jgi:hypothetical protein
MSVSVAGARRLRTLIVACLVVASVGAAFSGAGPARAATASFSPTPLASWRAQGVGWSAITIGNTAYVGGDFTSVTSPDGKTVVTKKHLAAFNLSTGALIQSFKADTDGIVYALATDGTNLYLGGTFTHVNGAARSRLAAVNPTTGAVRSWTANVDSTVYALGTSASYLYVGGAFGNVHGKVRHNLAQLRLSDASLQSWNPSPNGMVRSVAATSDASRVYVGGTFTKIAGRTAANLAAVNSTGGYVARSWSGIDGPALSMQLNSSGSRLVIGMGGHGNQGAMYNTSTGARLWWQGCDGDGQAVRWIGDDVFTGFHDTCGSDAKVRLTENDAASGARVSSFKPSFDKFWGVRALAGDAGHLVAAGDFTNVSGVKVQGIVIFPATG